MKCETQTQTQTQTLDPGAHAAALTGFIDDTVTVLAHVLPNDSYPNTSAMEALMHSLKSRVFPPLPVLATVVAYVCFTMQYTRKYRPLTTEELNVNAAAWRLSDALHGPRHH